MESRYTTDDEAVYCMLPKNIQLDGDIAALPVLLALTPGNPTYVSMILCDESDSCL